MAALVRRHPIATFLVAAYTLSIVIFAVPVLSEAGLGIAPIELPGIEPFLLLLTFAMVGVVYGITAIADGRDGVRELRRRMFRFRVSPIWYIAALFVLPLAALLVAVAFEGTAVLSALADDPGVALSWLAEIAVPLVLVNFWEEFAWSGFVLHRLQPRFGPVRATAATTWAHAALHLPLLVVIGGVSDTRIPAEMYPFYLAALFILPLGNRTVATWLYNRSGSSVPIAGLTHAAWNLTTGSAFVPALVAGYEPVWSYLGFGVVALVIIAITRGRLGYEADARAKQAAERGAVGSAGVPAR
jgi:membrane protease YdiL (CAAX protease family)